MLYGSVDQGLYAGVISGVDRDGGSSVTEGGDLVGHGIDGLGGGVRGWWNKGGGRRRDRYGFRGDDH